MQLSIKGLAIAIGAVWGIAVLLVGIAHLIFPNYGGEFLALVASTYPGAGVAGFGSLIIATIYAAVDGAIGGAIIAWIYNKTAAS